MFCTINEGQYTCHISLISRDISNEIISTDFLIYNLCSIILRNFSVKLRINQCVTTRRVLIFPKRLIKTNARQVTGTETKNDLMVYNNIQINII